MARKGQVSIQDSVDTNEEFDAYIEAHANQLICMEVYSEFCGYCLATGNAIRKGKLEIGQDLVAMVKAQSDKINILSRFRYKSEPVFLFILKRKLSRVMFGANAIQLCTIIEEELEVLRQEQETGIESPKIDISEMLPEEAVKLEEERKVEEEYFEAAERLRVLTLAARKKRVSERMAKNLKFLNFVMFWPHCHQAHYDLYEKWDSIMVNVAFKETFQLTEETAREVLYMSDVDLNEACMYALLAGEILVVLFKIYEDDKRDFVKMARFVVYEDIPVPKEDAPPEKQLPPIPAYERYAMISKTAREIRRDRYNAKMQKLREEREERERLAAEQARLAREAEEERLKAEKQKAEEERMARLAAGLPPEPVVEEPAEVGEEGAVEGEELEKTETEATEEAPPPPEDEEKPAEEEKPAPEEEFHSDVEVEGEDYIPPGGLFVPGLYAPPNELAKANGLKFFFPKHVTAVTPIETEHLPPHVLVMFNVDKRQEVWDMVQLYRDEIFNMGIFYGDDPFTAEHVAYSIKQYDKMDRKRVKQIPYPKEDGTLVNGVIDIICEIPETKDRLALMVSRKRSLPLLQLAGCNPCYISSDAAAGERDCLTLFPVGYGDEFVDEESVREEEVVVVVQPEPEPEPPAPEEKVASDEEED